MKKTGITLMIIGGLSLIVTYMYSVWWRANAPYCCTHICGRTVSISECSGSIVTVLLLIVSIGFITTGAALYET